MISYLSSALHSDKIPLSDIAEQVGTPTYVYSADQIKNNCDQYWNHFSKDFLQPHYAVKANSNLSVLKKIFAQGFGADVVSLGELVRCLQVGLPTHKIIFSGVGKTAAEIKRAVELEIFAINIESPHELPLIAKYAKELNVTARIAFRVNPDIQAKTHPKIATGLRSTKFGLDPKALLTYVKEAQSYKHVKIVGISCHIGSQILSAKTFEEACKSMLKIVKKVEALGCKLEFLDMGGGVGIVYENEKPINFKQYASALTKLVSGYGYKLILEPGRSIVGDAGVLLSQVITTKKTGSKNFMIIDAGMNDLMRPSLYDAFHEIVPLQQSKSAKKSWDIVGPVCETSDIFGVKRKLPELKTGDYVAILTAGAYGASMASTYNSRPVAAEVLVDGNSWKVIKQRPSLQTLWQDEINI